MKLLIAGGGTGGHLFPGIAVAEEFLSRGKENEVLFVGTERGIEARVLPRLGYPVEFISASGIRGKGNIARLRGMGMLLYSYAQSRAILQRFKPDIVLGVGGYASGPLVLAARGMLIRRFIHEQNAIPGFTNKVLSRFAEKVFLSLDESRAFFPKDKAVLTGNPLRRQILEEVLLEDAPGGKEKRTLFVFGGSAGAHRINTTMAAAAPLLADLSGSLEVIHQTGDKDLEVVTAAYAAAGIEATVVPFIDRMADAYRRADLIICRAGATTIAEVTACGKPCIFIPFPYATDDHQRRNAEALLKKGAGFMITEHELSVETLALDIRRLLSDPALLAETGEQARGLARLDAAQAIVDEMLKTN